MLKLSGAPMAMHTKCAIDNFHKYAALAWKRSACWCHLLCTGVVFIRRIASMLLLVFPCKFLRIVSIRSQVDYLRVFKLQHPHRQRYLRFKLKQLTTLLAFLNMYTWIRYNIIVYNVVIYNINGKNQGESLHRWSRQISEMTILKNIKTIGWNEVRTTGSLGTTASIIL